MDTKEIDVITRDVTRDMLLGINKETIQGFRVVTIRTICMHRGTDRSDIFSMIRRQIGGAAISHASAVAAILRCMNYFTGRDARSLARRWIESRRHAIPGFRFRGKCDARSSVA